MLKKCITVGVVTAAFLLCFCDKGDADDIRILFPGPGFEKGWSWHTMPAELPFVKLEQCAENNGIKLVDIEKAARVDYFFGNSEDSIFSVIMCKMKNDSIAEAHAGGFHEGGKYRRFANGSYIILMETEHPTMHMQTAMDTVASIITDHIASRVNTAEQQE